MSYNKLILKRLKSHTESAHTPFKYQVVSGSYVVAGRGQSEIITPTFMGPDEVETEFEAPPTFYPASQIAEVAADQESRGYSAYPKPLE